MSKRNLIDTAALSDPTDTHSMEELQAHPATLEDGGDMAAADDLAVAEARLDERIKSTPVCSIWLRQEGAIVTVEAELADGHYYEIIRDHLSDGGGISHCVTATGIVAIQRHGGVVAWERDTGAQASERSSDDGQR